MKVYWFDRVLIALAGLVLIAVGIAAILAAVNVVDFVGTMVIDLLIGDSTQMMVLVCVASTLVVLWGAYLCVFAALRRAS